jgi:oligopeptide transport system permease protein
VSERNLPEHIEEAQMAKYRLNQPLYQQFGAYLGLLSQGDLGPSIRYRNRSVNEILAQTLPVSFTLGALAFLLASTMGIWLGTLAATHKNSLIDNGAMLAALLAISIPTFITGPAFILIFSLWLGWFPVGGWTDFSTMVLPAICLALPYAAYIARLQRSSMLETVNEDFIRTARAKGLEERQVIYKHALKVGILPVISFLGPLAAHLLTGSIVVEKIFAVPGAGRFFIESVLNQDVFLLGGVVIVYCSLLVGFNLLVDVTYSLLDKRIALQ